VPERRVGVEYSPSYAGPGVTRQGIVLVCSPTFSHFLIVNKTSLSLSLSLLPLLPPPEDSISRVMGGNNEYKSSE
jgi:hypothetical protein